MEKVFNVFDYVFYQIYKLWLKEGDNVPVTLASVILSLIQFATILDLLLIVQQFTGYDKLVSKSTLAPVLIGIAMLNYFRYDKDFDPNNWTDRWTILTKKARIRNGFLIGLYAFLSLSFPIVYGLLKHNLHLI